MKRKAPACIRDSVSDWKGWKMIVSETTPYAIVMKMTNWNTLFESSYRWQFVLVRLDSTLYSVVGTQLPALTSNLSQRHLILMPKQTNFECYRARYLEFDAMQCHALQLNRSQQADFWGISKYANNHCCHVQWKSPGGKRQIGWSNHRRCFKNPASTKERRNCSFSRSTAWELVFIWH